MTPAGYKRSIYLPRELWARIHRAAKEDERTISQWMSIQLRDVLDLRPSDREELRELANDLRESRQHADVNEKGATDA